MIMENPYPNYIWGESRIHRAHSPLVFSVSLLET